MPKDFEYYGEEIEKIFPGWDPFGILEQEKAKEKANVQKHDGAVGSPTEEPL